MAPANGIHEHPARKLGKRRPLTGRKALMARDFLTGETPAHPLAADYLGHAVFGMYENDRFGVCGPTAVANFRRLVTATLTGRPDVPSQESVFDLYRRSGNPDFDPATGAGDRGVYVQEMLEAVQVGGIDGVRSVAFAKIDVDDRETLRAAEAVFGGVVYGVDLQLAQQTSGSQWDYTPGSGEWGGHAVLGGQYDADSIGVISWAERIDMTDRFVDRRADEAWVIVWPEHLTDRSFLAGVDVAALAGAFHSLTGEDLPVPPSPAPSGDVWEPTPLQLAALQASAGRKRPPIPIGQQVDRIVNGALHIKEVPSV